MSLRFHALIAALVPALLAACTDAAPDRVTLTVAGRARDAFIEAATADGTTATYQVATASGDYRVETRIDDLAARTVRTRDGATVLTLVTTADGVHACRDAACTGGPVAMDLALDDDLADARMLLGVDLAHLAPAPGATSVRADQPFAPPRLAGTELTLHGPLLHCNVTGGYESGGCTGVTISCTSGAASAACFAETCGDDSPGSISTGSSLCILF
jgi:hypothetical protein